VNLSIAAPKIVTPKHKTAIYSKNKKNKGSSFN
jgi:hypothetical protein